MISTIHGYNGTNPQAIRIDESTRSIQTISYVHHEIHAGSNFNAFRSDTLATGDKISVAITTPNTDEEQHVLWSLYCAGAITLIVYDTCTSYTGGTTFTPVNHNQRSTNSSNCTVKVGSDGALTDAVARSGGTVVDSVGVGSGNKSGGDFSHSNELILSKNAITIYEMVAVGNNIVCNLNVNWYEHTPKAA